MPLPVITDCWRVAFEWSGPQGLATNVMHFVDTTGSMNSTTVAGIIDSAVSENMWRTVSNGGVVGELNLRKLDGVDAGHIWATDGSSKWQGSGGTDFIPMACGLVKCNTPTGGRRGTGRIFLPWCAEGAQNSGVVESTNRSDMQSAWTDFLTSCNSASLNPSVASYVAAAASEITTYGVEAMIATQRRRFHRH